MLSERRWLRIHDFQTFRPSAVLENKRFLWETKDSQSDTGHSLLVQVDATHAGIITGNRKFYRPDYMQAGAHTWVPQGLPALPVLRAHDQEGEVLGRVREAKYVDDSWKYSGAFPSLKASIFYNQDSKASSKLDLFKTVDLVQDKLAKIKGYQGLGHIRLGLAVTNPEAIQKVLRDEYLCVSSGALTDAAICSVCHTDWASDDKCDHKVGENVDGKPVFLISGRFKYREISFVNFGADPFAQVKAKELKDSLEKMFFLGLPLDDQQLAIDKGLQLNDSLYASDIAIDYEEPVMSFDLAAARQTISDAALTAEQAFTVRDQMAAWHPETEEDKTAKRSLAATLAIKIKKAGWSVAVADAAVADADVASVPAVEDSQVADAVAEAEVVRDTEIKVISEDKIGGGEVEIQVSDELQGLAAEVKLFDEADTSEVAKDVLGHYDALDKIHKTAANDKKGLQYKMEDLHSALGDRWNKDRYVEWAKGYLASHVTDSQLVAKADLADKEDAVISLSEELEKIKTQITVKDKQIAAVFTDSKRSLATTIVMHKCLMAKDGFKDLTPAQVEDKIQEYAKRNIVSLKDAVADLFTELKWTSTTAPEPKATATEQGTTVNDNVRVDESQASLTDDEKKTAEQKRVRDALLIEQHLRLITNPGERARAAADFKYGRITL